MGKDQGLFQKYEQEIAHHIGRRPGCDPDRCDRAVGDHEQEAVHAAVSGPDAYGSQRDHDLLPEQRHNGLSGQRQRDHGARRSIRRPAGADGPGGLSQERQPVRFLL